ncbi:MAG: hypothetical protein ACK53L_19240, partial [Pirellulaceae bacterium]
WSPGGLGKVGRCEQKKTARLASSVPAGERRGKFGEDAKRAVAKIRAGIGSPPIIRWPSSRRRRITDKDWEITPS